MEGVTNIYCISTSKKVFSLNSFSGDSVIFVFSDEARANNFINQLILYAPNLPLIYLPLSTTKELKAYLLQKPSYVHVNPILDISFPKDDYQDTADSFLVQFKEEEACP